MSEFLNQNSIFVVLIIVLVIWGGIYYSLFRLDRRVKRLENKTKSRS